MKKTSRPFLLQLCGACLAPVSAVLQGADCQAELWFAEPQVQQDEAEHRRVSLKLKTNSLITGMD